MRYSFAEVIYVGFVLILIGLVFAGAFDRPGRPTPTDATAITRDLLDGKAVSFEEYVQTRDKFLNEKIRKHVAEKLGVTEESLRFLMTTKSVSVILATQPSTRPEAETKR